MTAPGSATRTAERQGGPQDPRSMANALTSRSSGDRRGRRSRRHARRRMRGTACPGQGNVRAKTGTLNAAAVSPATSPRQPAHIDFSILVDGSALPLTRRAPPRTRSPSPSRARALTRARRGRAQDALGPSSGRTGIRKASHCRQEEPRCSPTVTRSPGCSTNGRSRRPGVLAGTARPRDHRAENGMLVPAPRRRRRPHLPEGRHEPVAVHGAEASPSRHRRRGRRAPDDRVVFKRYKGVP